MSGGNILHLDITSKDNTKIKYVKKLRSIGNFRKKENKFIIEGIRLCYDAFLSSIHIVETYYTDYAIVKYREKANEVINHSERSYKVSDDILKSISDTKNPQGIVCICKELDKLSNLDKINNVGRFIILENIQDPSNLGTILRTAEALGIDAVIMSNDCCDIYNPKVLRGSMGAIFRMKIYFSDDICNSIKALKSKNIYTYAAVVDKSANSILEKDFKVPVAIVIGNEGNGLKKDTINACESTVTIPMLGKAESLNAAMATGIMMWEMMRGAKCDGL